MTLKRTNEILQTLNGHQLARAAVTAFCNRLDDTGGTDDEVRAVVNAAANLPASEHERYRDLVEPVFDIMRYSHHLAQAALLRTMICKTSDLGSLSVRQTLDVLFWVKQFITDVLYCLEDPSAKAKDARKVAIESAHWLRETVAAAETHLKRDLAALGDIGACSAQTAADFVAGLRREVAAAAAPLGGDVEALTRRESLALALIEESLAEREGLNSRSVYFSERFTSDCGA